MGTMITRLTISGLSSKKLNMEKSSYKQDILLKMKYCHEEVTKVGLPLVMVDTVAYEPTLQQDVRQFITLPHPITFEQKSEEHF